MAVIVTEEDKNRARYHLGYHLVESQATFALGIPAAMQTTFMIEGAMNRIMATTGAYERMRLLLDRMDQVEQEVFCGMDLASVDVLDTITVRKDRLRELAKLYKIAQQGLGNLLGVPPNPWDMRDWMQGASINVPVGG